jgi:hypothetical protein
MNFHSLSSMPWLLSFVADDDVRMYTMLFGLVAFSGGVLLMIRHKRAIDEILRVQRDERIRLFEQRKFRRRTTTSALIASIGVMLMSLYWARDPIPFTVLVCMILILLVVLLALAMLDAMSIGLHRLGTTKDPDQEKAIQDYLKNRNK